MPRCAALLGIVGIIGFATTGLAGPDLRLRYATFDPAFGVPAVPEALRAPAGSRIALVQFRAAPGPIERAALESRGCEVLRYIPDHAFVVRLPAGVEAAAVPGVRWSGPYHAAYKLDGWLLALASGGDGAPVRCGIELHDRGGAAQAGLDGALRAIGSSVEEFNPSGRRVEALLTASQLVGAARLDAVHFIDPSGPPGADMVILRQLTGATYLETLLGATGQGVRGEVFDTDLNAGHPAFQNPPPLFHGPVPPPGPGCHATSTFGIVFANDPLTPDLRGMLPDHEQGILATYQGVGMPPNPQHLAELVDPNLPYRGVFQTRAIGSPQTSTYTTISAAMDDALLLVDIAVTQAMSNTGGPQARPEAWAKNIIGVGGVDHEHTVSRADDSVSGSATGPAWDGRIKPDVVSVYDGVTTVGGCVNPPAPPGYTVFFGTSAGTSIVAGQVGLICQLWHEQVFEGFGGGASVFDDRPGASTIRALLINSAYQYDWTAGGAHALITRVRQGWGMPDLQTLHERAARTFVVNETDVLVPQQARIYRVVVPVGEPALKVTMVYADPPGSPAVQSQHRVNDLTLRVVAPSGLPYWGNFGLTAGVWSNYGGAPDTRNVIENVFIQNPQPGAWTIEVSAPELVMDAHLETPEIDADFALVVSGVQDQQPCYPDCTGEGLLSVADFGCFQGKYVLGDPYADCTGEGSLTVADFGCFQGKYVLGCP